MCYNSVHLRTEDLRRARGFLKITEQVPDQLFLPEIGCANPRVRDPAKHKRREADFLSLTCIVHVAVKL